MGHRRRQRHERDGRHYGQYRRHLRHPPRPSQARPNPLPSPPANRGYPNGHLRARTGSRRGKCKRFRVRRGAPSAPTPLLSASCVVTAAEAGGASASVPERSPWYTRGRDGSGGGGAGNVIRGLLQPRRAAPLRAVLWRVTAVPWLPLATAGGGGSERISSRRRGAAKATFGVL
jgi:hypothetical protein